MDGGRTTTRQYSEYSDFFTLYTTRTRVRSRYRPTSAGVHPSQTGRTRRETRAGFWSGVYPGLPVVVDTNVEQEVGQLAIGYLRRRVYTETVSGISHGSVPCLHQTDGPDSTTAGSDIPEGHADRPPEVEYSERLTSAKRQDEGWTEALCSPHMELEMAVIQLQRDVEDCRSELELARKWTPAVTLRPQRRSGFTSTLVP